MNALLTGVLSGATTALYDTRVHGIAGLAPWIAASGVSVVHASPAILRAFVAARPDPRQLAGLRSFTLAGEAAHGRDVLAARSILPPGCAVHHRLGSTETGLVAHLVLTADDPVPDGPLPVGTPIGSTEVRLVDEDGAPVAEGEPGIVEVTRGYLATGYLDDDAATAAAFATAEDGRRRFRSRDVARWDADGSLMLLGRRDHSVKIRGYLVEPGEVDAALFALPEVREAVTVGLPRPSDGVLELVSYLVPAVQQASPAAIRAALREVLPSHLVPPTIVLLDALPRTERGKVDRSALPEPTRHRAGSAGQEFSAWERLVAQVFEKALSVEEIGLDDDFFELGGDSLAAEALVTQMVEGLGVDAADVTTALLVQAPTVRGFAARLSRRPEGDDVLVPIQPTGSRTPLFVVAGGGGLGVAFLWLARLLGADQPVWGLQAHGLERRGLPDRSVQAIARRNLAALRTVQPEGPYLLAGHSFGGAVAFEMAHRLRAAGQKVAGLVLLDVYPPDPARLPADPPLPLVARLKRPVGLALTGIRRTSPGDVFWEFYRFSGELQRRYRGAPWSGNALVVVAEDEEHAELRGAWDEYLTGPWERVDVPGDHLSMIRDPYVARTAAVVGEALARWRAARGDDPDGSPVVG
jgi:thioesterase domain-containing protein